MADETGEISSAMIIGVGIVLFAAIVGIWYVVIR